MLRPGVLSHRSFVYEEQFKAKYKLVGLVETHVEHPRDLDLRARAPAQGFDSYSNPAMKYSSTKGTHGGEVILTPKFTYSEPIEQIILETANNPNDETLGMPVWRLALAKCRSSL